MSFLPCTLLSPSDMYNGCRQVMPKGWRPAEKKVAAARWLSVGARSPHGEGEPVLGRGEWGSASLARMAGPYVTGRCLSPLADVVAPTVPQLQVPPCVRQSCQQGEVLRLRAYHPQRPWQPLLRCEPSLHCGGDWVCRWGGLPRHSHPPGELCQAELAFTSASRGWRRAGLSRELDCTDDIQLMLLPELQNDGRGPRCPERWFLGCVYYMSCLAACSFFNTSLHFISHLTFLYNQQELCCWAVCLLGEITNKKAVRYRGQKLKGALVAWLQLWAKENMVGFGLPSPLWKNGDTVIRQWSSSASSTWCWKTFPFRNKCHVYGFWWLRDLMRRRSWLSDVYCFRKIRHALMWINFRMRLWALWNQGRTDERQKFSL